VPERDDPGDSDYGNVNGKLLAQQYFDSHCDRKQCLDKQQVLKYDLVKWKNRPVVAKVANAVVSLLVSNVCPERGASALKLIKTRLCSRMQNDLLNTLLHILINGPAVGRKQCKDVIDSAVSSWLGAKTWHWVLPL